MAQMECVIALQCVLIVTVSAWSVTDSVLPRAFGFELIIVGNYE